MQFTSQFNIQPIATVKPLYDLSSGTYQMGFIENNLNFPTANQAYTVCVEGITYLDIDPGKKVFSATPEPINNLDGDGVVVEMQELYYLGIIVTAPEAISGNITLSSTTFTNLFNGQMPLVHTGKTSGQVHFAYNEGLPLQDATGAGTISLELDSAGTFDLKLFIVGRNNSLATV